MYRRSHFGGRAPLRLGLAPAHGIWPCAVVVVLLTGCGDDAEQPPADSLVVRDVRVLLFDSAEGCQVRVDGPFRVAAADGRILSQGDELGWTQVDPSGGIRFRDVAGVAEEVSITAERYGTIHVADKREGRFLPGRQYAGSLTVEVRDHRYVRAINVVDVESYVAGVVPNEVAPGFHDQSLRCQAIAARTYVLYLMSQRADRAFDLVASEGDQVYGGVRLDDFGSRVSRAVDATRGVVLCHVTADGERVFCAYYSAACGGATQSIADVQQADAPPPLRGQVRCDFCRIAPGDAYRWGPVEISKAELLRSLQARDPEFAEWTRIDAVEVTRNAQTGRLTKVTVLGGQRGQVAMPGERFRLAVGSRLMRSTDCDLIDQTDVIRFENGKGFGHGVGLCQWGMEGQARAGRTAAEILQYYFPGSKLRRAY